MRYESGRSIRYQYRRSTGGSILDTSFDLSFPKKPSTGRVVHFTWEINHPSIGAGADVNWTSVSAYNSDPDVEIIGSNALLSLLKFDSAIDVASGTTKTGLLIRDVWIYVGTDVTTGAMASNQTAITTTVYSDTDNTNSNQAVRWQATAWPAAPSGPAYDALLWTTAPAVPVLLNNQHRRLFLKLHNAAGGSFNAGWMRIVAEGFEL